MKYANKIGAMFTMVLGDTEIEQNTAKIKNMDSGEESEIRLDTLSEDLNLKINLKALEDLAESL